MPYSGDPNDDTWYNDQQGPAGGGPYWNPDTGQWQAQPYTPYDGSINPLTGQPYTGLSNAATGEPFTLGSLAGQTGTGGTGGTGVTGTGTGTGNGTIGGLLAPFTGQFTQPAPLYPGATGTGVPETPVFNAPAYQKPPAFSYADYQLPSFEEAQNEPGFQFGLKNSLTALQQRAASKGSLNTGGTIKGLIDYARNAADQQYGDVSARSLQTYNTNRNNAADIYATNAFTQYAQPYEAAYRSAVDSFAPQMTAYSTNASANQRGNEQNYSNLWDQYLTGYDQFRDQRDSTFGKLYQYLTA